MKRNSNYSKQRLLRKEFLSFIRGKCKHFPVYLSQAKHDKEISVKNKFFTRQICACGPKFASIEKGMVISMKKNKTAICIVGICLIVVGMLAGISGISRPQIPMHSIMVEYDNQSEHIDIDTLRLSEVTGEIVNGKGEVKEVTGQGILLRDVLDNISKADYDTVKVISDDEYFAELTKSEILDEDKAYLMIADDQARLYVFGDKNSKRNVSNVVKICL